MMKKVKGFMEEHPVLTKTVATVGVLTVGCVIGWKACSKNKFKLNVAIGEDSCLCKYLLDVIETYPESFSAFKVNHATGATPAILGELGEAMLDSGVPEDHGFTHFLAIGPKCK